MLSMLSEIQVLADAADESYGQYLADKQERDVAIREAIAAGVSMYSIAKSLGLSESAIAYIRDQGKEKS